MLAVQPIKESNEPEENNNVDITIKEENERKQPAVGWLVVLPCDTCGSRATLID